MSKSDIAELGPIEYMEAMQYSVMTYNTRNMSSSDKNTPAGADVASFDQKPDFDIDPLFVSNVGK